ncbi:MAG TPA: TetR family transcriptional regulator [Streptosporangiaceae bacterium]|nr:TetR family transcriptional regulator [Streptosporangiaceae bacterium]
MNNSSEAELRPGLRERKKARTRASIREHALRLFREQGYDATTVDQIAEAADVSPSTFFRYYPTKEDVVLQDDFDLIAIDSFLAQPAELSVVAAFRAATKEMVSSLDETDLAELRETTALIMTVPELRARAMDEYSRTIEGIATAAAQRTGRSPDDSAVMTAAGAIVGVIMAVALPWGELGDLAEGKTATADFFGRIDAALANLEGGLKF